MKNILFPKICRPIGWVMFVPALLAAVLVYFNIINLSETAETLYNNVVIIGIVLGALFIVCSKVTDEDEMTRALRLSSILNALYACTAILITGTLFINGTAYLEFLIFSLLLFPITFVFIFTAEMHRYYKQDANEE